MWAVQHYRLMEIAEGRLKPHFEREHMFLWTLNAHHIAHPSQFILPGRLFMAETQTNPLKKVAAWYNDEERAAMSLDATAS